MSNLRVNWTRDEAGQENLTVYFAGKNYTANNTHLAWDELLVKAMDDDVTVVDMFDIGKAVGKRLELTDRVSYAKGFLFLDGDRISDGLAEHIIRMIQADEKFDPTPFVLLLENILQNPSDNSRKQLYRYIDRHHITITWDGKLVLYKYVNRNTDKKVVGDDTKVADYLSGNAGPAFVNGAPHSKGQVPQSLGDVVSMPRADVEDNAGVPCASGLHVGAWGYIASHTCKLEIEVHPRDVVSVPSDSNEQKIRVCRYRIIGEVTKLYDEPVKPKPEPKVIHVGGLVDPEIESPVLQPVDPTQTPDIGVTYSISPPERPVKHPTQKEIDKARIYAKLQKKSLQVYVEKRLKWRYLGGEVKDRKSWSVK